MKRIFMMGMGCLMVAVSACSPNASGTASVPQASNDGAQPNAAIRTAAVPTQKHAFQPDDAFLDSLLVLRPGVQDTELTVRQYVARLSRLAQPDGTPAKIFGWKRTLDGYALTIKVAGKFDVAFTWSKNEGLALMNDIEMDGEVLPSMHFFMLTLSMPPVAAKEAPEKPEASPVTSVEAKQTRTVVPWRDYLGQHPSMILTNSMVATRFKSLLGKQYSVFETNLEVAGELGAWDDELITGSGNAPHEGGYEEAAFAINTATDTYYAVILSEGKSLTAFGVEHMRELPEPLKEWVLKRGGEL